MTPHEATARELYDQVRHGLKNRDIPIQIIASALAQAEKDGMMQMAERCADLVVSEEVNDHASAFLEKKIRQLAKELNEEGV